MTVFGLSDAVMSLGLPWDEILTKVPRQKISCISGCAVAQADKYGMGGMFQSSMAGSRVTSKHMAMSLGEGSADFAHAYVLGSMGSTGQLHWCMCNLSIQSKTRHINDPVRRISDKYCGRS